ncbi:transcription factor MafK-like [Trichogramma pretiosum]|uniref:transcription factor MafK-like n=1 Tax=Trichogramma pretiosum TaxID=7493 RepID=UPI0006C9AD98|nr:transcription factor MafK-like [Trichogramma pretiosum]
MDRAEVSRPSRLGVPEETNQPLDPPTSPPLFGVSDDVLISYDLKDMNKLMNSLDLSDDQKQILRSRRRKLKNQDYAANRDRERVEKEGGLEFEKDQEYDELEQLQEENDKMLKELILLNKKCQALMRFAIERSIPLPPGAEADLRSSEIRPTVEQLEKQ